MQYTIEYWLMFEALNMWIYPQTSVSQQRFMCIANDYSYFTHYDLIPVSQPKQVYHQPLQKSGSAWFLSYNEANMVISFVFHKYE